MVLSDLVMFDEVGIPASALKQEAPLHYGRCNLEPNCYFVIALEEDFDPSHPLVHI
jgi:hypothetical protein